MTERHAERVQLSELLRQCPGRWVAMHNGEIVEVRETFDKLMLALHERDITNVTVIRSPDIHEPELVGLG